MKRWLHSLFPLLLSALLVWMGTGVIVMQCMHSGRMMLVLPLAQQQEKKDCRGDADTHCMKVQVMKLATMNQTSQQSLHIVPQVMMLLPMLLVSAIMMPRWCCHAWSQYLHADKWHSPPRCYLQQLSVLII